MPKARGITSIYRPEFQAWVDMRKRCGNPTNSRYKDYGGRGITVCARWQAAFAVFLADMGPRPSAAHSLDRKNNNKGYTPGNCRWATEKRQKRNTRRTTYVTYGGKKRSTLDWAPIVNLPHYVLTRRARRGWSAKRILLTPLHGHYEGARSATINGVTMSIRKWAIHMGFKCVDTVLDRMKRGWSARRAILTPARAYHRK